MSLKAVTSVFESSWSVDTAFGMPMSGSSIIGRVCNTGVANFTFNKHLTGAGLNIIML